MNRSNRTPLGEKVAAGTTWDSANAMPGTTWD